jgi:uncharacterized membrane protein
MTADDENAFRAPQANSLPHRQPPPVAEGAWRDGPCLIVHRSFRDYPQRCIVCNAPTQTARSRVSVRWVRAPIVLIIVGLAISPPLALVIWMALPTAFVFPRVCDEHLRRETWGRRIPWILALLGIVAFVGSLTVVVSASDADGMADLAIPVGMLMAISGVIIFWVAIAYGVMRPRMLTASKIDKQFVWLDKVSQEYLQQFSELGPP